ncbi:MAG: hypothetical protein Aurels2KO_47080 [Aureliella sp.]
MSLFLRRSVLGLFVAASACCISSSAISAEKEKKTEVPKALSFTMPNLSGKKVDLADYKGKVILVVNVASECGLTDRNYKELQEVYAKYKDKGLVVLGFPCNQFGMQEPGSSKEISEFCSNKYDVSFDLFEKVNVNGEKACDLYKHLTALDLKPKGKGKVSWNFEKFLINRAGEPVARYKPQTSPKKMLDDVEKLLAEK